MEAAAKYILDAIVSRIQVVDGTGVYNYDLSGAGTVARRQRFPASSPAVCVYLPLSDETEYLTLSQHEVNLTVRVDFRLAPTLNDYATTEDAALALQSDIVRVLLDVAALNAITTIAANPVQVLNVVSTRAYRHGDDNSSPDMPTGVLIFEVRYKRTLTGGI
jgi:hypothetical protein